MMIWLLALILLASLAALGYRQGAIRVAFSLIGIILGIILAGPLGKLLKPALGAVGVKNPVLLWVLGPVIVFVLISIIFKIAALAVHQKVDVYYKYRAGDLRLARWERLNERVGLCLGLVNGALYLSLISFVVYALSYWTVQMASGETDPWVLRRLNGLGQDLHSSGFAKVTSSIDPLPQTFYDTADLAGLIYNNSLLEARLQRYPGFLGLAERAEFSDLANDKEFTEMWQRHDPVKNVLDHPKAQVILNNPDLLRMIWQTLIPDLQDLRTFLTTGKSPKYDPEKILGRWDFDLNYTMIMVHKAILWRDLESIKNASITAPQRHTGGWRVCVRLDTKGAFGRFTGERDYLVALYGADRRPELVMEDAAAACAAEPHVPFPELEGGYVRLEPDKKSKADDAKPDRK